MSYFSLADIYDEINGSAYEPYTDYLVSAFECADIEVREVLDLGCGTGGICALLADRGYDMVGLDYSPEMLNIARERNFGKNTLLLCQDMRDFELYGTVQAVYSSFDCLNYLENRDDLARVFSLVHNYLEPGGVFAFDVNTRFRFEEIYDGHSFVYPLGDDMAVWQNVYDRDEKRCTFDIDVFFAEEDGMYSRVSERQTETLFEREDILASAVGFALCEVSGGKGFDGCGEGEKEYYIFKRI